MKKQKGFTLIEVLGVLILLGILLMIVVPSIQRYMRKGTKEYYQNLEKTLILSGKDYFEDYRTLLPREIGNVAVIPLKELLVNKYIDPVVDSNGKACEARVVAKKQKKTEYDYYACLLCEDYKTEGQACQYDENNNITTETKDYVVKIEENGNYEIEDNGVYIVEQGMDFNLPKAKIYYKNKEISEKAEPNPRVIDTNKLGEVKVSYVYRGAKAEIIVKVVDRVGPSIPQIVLKKNNKEGAIYIGNWYSGDIYEEYKSIDYSKKEGILGSGIDYYEISTNGKDYNKLDHNYHISTNSGNHTYYIRAVDKSGNIGEANSYQVKVDKEAPVCVLEVTEGTLGENSWYRSNLTVDFKKVDGTNSKVTLSSIDNRKVTQEGVTTIYGTVVDEAGNSGTCKIDAKIDRKTPDAPIITASDNIESGNWHMENFSLNYSGASNISGNTYYYGTTTNPETSGSNTQISSNTLGTIYYVKVCSGAGLCSSNSNYQVKLDTVRPSAPIITASDNIESGNWHRENFNLSASLNGEPNISGNTFYYGTTTNPVTKLTSSIGASSDTESSNYYIKVCSGAGLCSSNSNYQVKLDKGTPTIVAKQDNTYIRWDTKPNTTPADYFSITTGVSGGTVSCTVNNVNELPLGVNTVTCTVTGGNGLSSSASTVFRHQYTGTPYCESGGILTNNNTACYYGSNSSVCGSSCTSYAQVYNPCKTTTNTCQPGQDCTTKRVCSYRCTCSGVPNQGTWTPMEGSCSANSGYVSDCRSRGGTASTSSYNCHDKQTCVTNPCKTGSPNECVPGYDTGSCNGWVANSCSKSDFTYLKYSCPDGGTYNTSNKLCQF